MKRLLFCAILLSCAVSSSRAATYTVINTNDTGAGSLRWAITSALSSAPPNEIHFNIPGPGPHTIKVGAILPHVTNATAILGNTQPGYAGTPLIHIQGPTTSGGDVGLVVGTTNASVQVRALRLSGFTQLDYGAGISVGGPNSQVAACVLDGNFNGVMAFGGTVGGTNVNDRNIIINNENGIWMITNSTATIRGNFIGVQADGVTPAGNVNGIRSFYTSGRLIEGHPNYPQVISGNSNAGILLGPHGGYVWQSSTFTIRGNRIGTDITGMLAVPNNIGIHSWGGNGHLIGGTTTNHRNIISGNNGAGVLIEGMLVLGSSAFDNQVYGNYIGLAADGMTPLENDIGVLILNGVSNFVGGTSAGQGNRFGASEYDQIQIRATPMAYGTNAPVLICYSNVVQGNWIGISTGNTVIAGGQTGIYILEATNNLIGGTSTAARNVIGGSGTGIYIAGTNARNNRVIGNLIGCGPGGELLPNFSYGVSIFNAADNIIGGNYTNEANTISGNQHTGVRIHGTGSFNNVVAGNRIGTDPTGTLSVSNRYAGISFQNGAFSNLVGGTDYSRANVIAGNGGTGVSIADTITHGNQVSYNFIGMNTNFMAITNGGHGVEIFNASSNLIGGANYIGNSRSPSAGIRIAGTNAWGNIVFGNVVGMDNAGNRHPNAYGIDVADARNTIIGFSIFTRNVVSGNNSGGIEVRGQASNTQVRFNYIGTDILGIAPVRNNGYGLRISAPFTLIGGTNADNVISGSGSDGIFIESSGSNAVVQGNYVGLDASGSYVLTNGGAGIRVDARNVLIGGSVAGARNIISGNNNQGIAVLNGADTVTIQGNYIGLDFSGAVGLTNRQYGIYVNDSSNVVIGGAGLARNLISANRFAGVLVAGTSSNTIIAGNYIGLSANGLNALGNIGPGVSVSAHDVWIGVPLSGYGNYIAGNTSAGIQLNTGGMTRIRNNVIGLGVDGLTNIPNNGGISVAAGAQSATIGGTNALERNVIARNGLAEITINGSGGNHVLQGNFIGVRDFGVAFPTMDSARGVEVLNSPSNRIVGNVIGQVAEALYLGGTGTISTVVQGNFIGEYNLEPLTNSSWGVTITNARNSLLGGFTADERNLITGNNGGVLITGTNARNNDVARNLIFGNSARLNIDLGPLGFNTNDVNDVDEGANRLQNRPQVTSGYTVSPSMFVYAQGVLTSAPSTTYAIDVFRAQGTNASAYRYLGRTFTTTDGGGVGTFVGGFAFNLAAGEYLSATATDPDGNTSELAVSPSGVTAATPLDSDNDGIPDYWEILHGLNPASSNAPNADFDLDGFSDFEEYIADTAANDGAVYPVITAFGGGTNHTVTFPSSPIRVYALQGTESLETGPWTAVGGSVTGQFGSTTMVDTNALDGRSYRFTVRLP